MAHTLVLGVGEFGELVLQALKQAGYAHPACDLCTASALPGQEALDTRVLTHSWKRSGELPPHLVLAAHLQEPFASQNWLKLLQQARGSFAPYSFPEVTLLLAIDSDQQESRPALEAALAGLEAELEDASRDGAPAIWCYLMDTLDMFGQPLVSVPDETTGMGRKNQALRCQAHQAAEMVMALAEGLSVLPAYRRTSLNEMNRNFRGHGAATRVSALGICTLHLVVPGTQPSDALRLASQLLAEFLPGASSPDYFAAAQRLFSRWQEECRASLPALNAQLRREENGQPWVFPLNTPHLQHIAAADLLTQVQHWLAGLDVRWGSPDSPAERLGAAADHLITRSAGWMERELGDLLGSQPAGIHLAQSFLQMTGAFVQSMRTQPGLSPVFTGDHRNWLDVLWRAWIGLPSTDSLAACQLALQAAEADYQRILQDISTCRGFSRLLKPFHLPHLLRSWVRLRLCAVQVVEAAGKYYARRMCLAQKEALNKISAALQEQAGSWKEKTAAHAEGLADALTLLKTWESMPNAPVLPQPLLTERFLLPENLETASLLAPSLELAERFLSEEGRLLVKTDAPELAKQLCQFALALLEGEGEHVPFWERVLRLLPSWRMYAASGKKPDPAAAMAVSFASDLSPCFPLTPEERAALATVLPVPSSNLTPVIPLVFYGRPRLETVPFPEMDYQISDPGRVTILFSLHGLDTRLLRVLQPQQGNELEEPALPEEKEAVK